MTYKCKRILSVLQEHPLKWMTSNEIAKHELCKKWATTTIVAELLSIGEFPGIEYRDANLRYRNSTKQYQWNPEGA